MARTRIRLPDQTARRYIPDIYFKHYNLFNALKFLLHLVYHTCVITFIHSFKFKCL